MRNRTIFTVVVLIILVGIGVAYFYFSDMNLIPNSFLTPIGATEGILAILLTAGQWLVPIPSSDTKKTALSVGNSYMPDNSYIQGVLLKSIKDQLAGGNAALVVYEKRSNIGEDVSLGYRKEVSIVERVINGYPLVAAVFLNVEPGSYFVRGPSESKFIRLHPGDIIELDWSRTSKKGEVKKNNGAKDKGETIRKRRSIDLRANSLLVGFGGLSFIAQLYFQTPYRLDIVGILLAGLGIVNLFLSFFLDWLDWRKAGHLRFNLLLIGVGGGMYLAEKYSVTPYHLNILGYPLNVIGFFIMALGGAYLLLTLFFGWFDWYLKGGGVVLFVTGLAATLIIIFRDVTGPYLRIAGFVLLGIMGALLVANLIIFIVAKSTGKNFYEWLDNNWG